MVIDVLKELSASIFMLKQSKTELLHPEDERQYDSSKLRYVFTSPYSVTPQITAPQIT
jgi:hypothetical protein